MDKLAGHVPPIRVSRWHAAVCINIRMQACH